MNTPIFTPVKRFTKLLVLAVALGCAISSTAQAEWKLDLSRRQKEMRDIDMNAPGRAPASEQKTVMEVLFEPSSDQPTQDIVVLNTDKGFVPSTLRLRKDGKYNVHVVNINEKEKNVSFVLDAFSEHHATYYGKIKSFQLEPKKEGIYSFQCPETSAEGRVVIFAPSNTALPIRLPAQEATAP